MRIGVDTAKAMPPTIPRRELNSKEVQKIEGIFLYSLFPRDSDMNFIVALPSPKSNRLK